MKPSIALIGPGKVGCAVCARLYAAGHQITAIVGRDLPRTKNACHFVGCSPELASTDLVNAVSADIIMIAVPDDSILQIRSALYNCHPLAVEQSLVHFSGLQPASILGESEQGAPGLLALHPLLSFADREEASKRLEHCPCALEGNQRGLATGAILIASLNALAFTLKAEAKATYHCAASIASNFLITLMASAQQLLRSCQIEEQQSLKLLEPLVRATVDNLFATTPEQALTGPIVRGDLQTVANHLTAIEANQPELTDLYHALAQQTLILALRSGRLDDAKGQQLQNLLCAETNRSQT